MQTSHPNVLLITTDQQRADSMSCYGSPFTQTPALDRLACEGVRFDRAYCTNPVCTPARASIFSGRYVSRHGAWNVGMNIPEDEAFLSHRLGAVGYRTHYIGKAHFQGFGGSPAQSMEAMTDWACRYPAFTGPYYGFSTVELALGHTHWGLAGHYGAWVRRQVTAEEFAAYRQVTCRAATSFGGEAYDWALPTALHNSVWTASRTVEWLERQDPAHPFFLAVGFQDPHHPHCLPTDFTERVDPSQVPLTDYMEGELNDKPPHFREAHEGTLEHSAMRGEFWIAGQGAGADFREVSENDTRLGRAYYYSMCKLIDQQIGRILEALDRTGLAENTLIIFTTDHGELLGDHGLWMKGPFHYEQLVRIPLLLRWPCGISSSMQTSALISQVDLAPTVLEAVGLPVPAGIDGSSALPFLRGEAERIRPSALVECVDDPHKLRLKTLITSTHKLTWYAGQSSGELYDLEADPRERVNRWDDPTCATVKASMLAELLTLQEPLERRQPRYCYA
ncbi:MAG: sulfatase family protein [Armatimonadota bacterium]